MSREPKRPKITPEEAHAIRSIGAAIAHAMSILGSGRTMAACHSAIGRHRARAEGPFQPVSPAKSAAEALFSGDPA